MKFEPPTLVLILTFAVRGGRRIASYDRWIRVGIDDIQNAKGLLLAPIFLATWKSTRRHKPGKVVERFAAVADVRPLRTLFIDALVITEGTRYKDMLDVGGGVAWE